MDMITPREQLHARIEALEAQLCKDRDQFLFYGRNHRAKADVAQGRINAVTGNKVMLASELRALKELVADTTAKAETNERMAIEIANLLNEVKPSDHLTPSADVS